MESRAQKILSGSVEKVKAVNLPSWNKLKVEMEHILSGHRKGGGRLAQSIEAGGTKDIFPEWLSDKQILKAIETAYGNAKKVETQTRFNGEKIAVLVGEADNMKIKMYVNLTTKTLETAFSQLK